MPNNGFWALINRSIIERNLLENEEFHKPSFFLLVLLSTLFKAQLKWLWFLETSFHSLSHYKRLQKPFLSGRTNLGKMWKISDKVFTHFVMWKRSGLDFSPLWHIPKRLYIFNLKWVWRSTSVFTSSWSTPVQRQQHCVHVPYAIWWWFHHGRHKYV